MHIPVHSPWLPGYIDIAQTIHSHYINNGWTFFQTDLKYQSILYCQLLKLFLFSERSYAIFILYLDFNLKGCIYLFQTESL